MLTIYLGGIEVGDGFAINGRVTDVAHSVADLASQYVTIDSQDMTNILGASTQIIAPYATTGIIVSVSEVTTPAQSSTATVTWSASLNGTARAQGSPIILPASLQTLAAASLTPTKLILGEVSYPYTPSIGYVLTSTITMSDSFYLMPRLSDCITYNGAC
jgi:Flp pilus assembly protein TadG